MLNEFNIDLATHRLVPAELHYELDAILDHADTEIERAERAISSDVFGQTDEARGEVKENRE